MAEGLVARGEMRSPDLYRREVVAEQAGDRWHAGAYDSNADLDQASRRVNAFVNERGEICCSYAQRITGKVAQV